MSDTNTKIALWLVGSVAALATLSTLALGTARPSAQQAQSTADSAPLTAGSELASASDALPPGLSLLSMVAGSSTTDPSAPGGVGGPEAAQTQAAAPDLTPAETGAPLAQVAFDAGQSGLSTKAKALLADIASGVKAMDGAVVTLSGFHDASGSPELNAALAKERALAVRDELVAKGMPAERIRLLKPQAMLGDADPASARRVDIGLIR